MKIFTSIAPRKIEIQQRALKTWVDAGFQPVSLNSPAEIEQLATPFPKVEFIETDRDATAITGKPFVFIDDLFAALAASGEEVSGLVNSDIIFRSSLDLPKLFHERAAGGLVFGSRMDINQPQDTAGELFRIGYDYFFIDTATARGYPPTSLSMGAPMWDYWTPLIPVLKGSNCSLMNGVCAFHVRHEQNWDNKLNIRMMKEIIDHSGIEFEGIAGVDFNTDDKSRVKILRQFAQFIVPFLETNSRLVFQARD